MANLPDVLSEAVRQMYADHKVQIHTGETVMTNFKTDWGGECELVVFMTMRRKAPGSKKG